MLAISRASRPKFWFLLTSSSVSRQTTTGKQQPRQKFNTLTIKAHSQTRVPAQAVAKDRHRPRRPQDKMTWLLRQKIQRPFPADNLQQLHPKIRLPLQADNRRRSQQGKIPLLPGDAKARQRFRDKEAQQHPLPLLNMQAPIVPNTKLHSLRSLLVLEVLSYKRHSLHSLPALPRLLERLAIKLRPQAHEAPLPHHLSVPTKRIFNSKRTKSVTPFAAKCRNSTMQNPWGHKTGFWHRA